ncbi:MAG TPA: hypothetical protein VK154_02660 [Chitinophagales bacterium]|nr:hypothetical protein [Chitinophagales bacterium]
MIDLILVCLFCYQLNRLARERGITPWPFVLNYLAIFFIMMLAFVYGFIAIYGTDAFKNEQGIKAAMMFEPFAIMFEVFLFIYFRKRIQKTVPVNNDNDYTPPPPTKEKKDLSYFR